MSRLRRLGSVELPKGAVALLCALVLALPAGLAIAHNPKLDSGGGWQHHHATSYTTCNYVNQDANLETQANNARQNWRSLSLNSNGSTYGLTEVSFPSQADCHPGSGDQTHLQLQDAYYGNTGWRVSSTDEPGANAFAHARHTHINFNLSNSWSAYTNYDRRALACRAIGEVIGVDRVYSGSWASHGDYNDCMSFGGSPTSQVSAAENENNYTYTDRPGAHSRDLLDPQYAQHGPTITSVPSDTVWRDDENDPVTIDIDGEGVGLTSLKVYESVGGDLTLLQSHDLCAGSTCPPATSFELDLLPEGQRTTVAYAYDEGGFRSAPVTWQSSTMAPIPY